MQNLKLAADIKIGDKINLAKPLEVVAIGGGEYRIPIWLKINEELEFKIEFPPSSFLAVHDDDAPTLVSGFVCIEKITADRVKPGDEIRLIGIDVPDFAKVLGIEPYKPGDGHRLRIYMDLPIGSNVFNLSPDALVELFTSHRYPAATEPEETPSRGELMDRICAYFAEMDGPITIQAAKLFCHLIEHELLDISRLIELSNDCVPYIEDGDPITEEWLQNAFENSEIKDCIRPYDPKISIHIVGPAPAFNCCDAPCPDYPHCPCVSDEDFHKMEAEAG